MKLIFNHKEKGQEELKTLLGFFDADITYSNIETDIALQTPDLVEFIGQPMYDKLVEFYEGEQTDAALKSILKNAQLYILLFAYLEYAANGDIIHGNNGRKIHFSENEKTPWDWQIKMDNGALKRRAYKALDQLIELLDKSTYPEWLESEQCQEAKSLFLFNTRQLGKIYPINNSGQLYYRLVPFMADVETETLKPTIGITKFEELKTKIKGTLSAEEKELILYCQKITAYRVLERASVLLPEEMLSSEINYKLSEKESEYLREKRAKRFNEMAAQYEIELQRILARQNAEAYQLNPIRLDPEKKHVNL